jgi:arylsulfatase
MKTPGAPNILFVMTDQQRFDALGCAGTGVLTPHLDALAARGVRFTQAVCNVPMCVPSRYSLMTGLYGSQIGVRNNVQMIARDADLPAPVLAQRLGRVGYRTAGFGKTHWYVNRRIMPQAIVEPSTRGFETRAIQYSRDSGDDEPCARYFRDERPQWQERLSAETAAFGLGGEEVTGYVGCTSGVPPEHHSDAWLAEQAVAFITEAGGDRPWFVYLGLDSPHPGFNVPAGYEELYDLRDMPDKPPPSPALPSHQPGRSICIDNWPAMSGEQRRTAQLRYRAMCSFADAQIGRVLTALERTGQAGNTLVVFTADHGEMLGDRGRASKFCLYEGSVHVPRIVAGPGAPGGTVDPRPAELVDVVPTLLRTAGIDADPTLAGHDLLAPVSRPGSFAEMHGYGGEPVQAAFSYMWRTADWKLVLTMPGAAGDADARLDEFRGELYRLSEDPIEVDNLYYRPDFQAIRETMSRQLLAHLAATWSRFPARLAKAPLRR